jgi:hypothetical protein
MVTVVFLHSIGIGIGTHDIRRQMRYIYTPPSFIFGYLNVGSGIHKSLQCASEEEFGILG